MSAVSDENENMKRAEEAIVKYFFQLTEGCGKQNCSNTNCASNSNFIKQTRDQAAALAIQLAKDKAELCESSAKSAKQFKTSSSSIESTIASALFYNNNNNNNLNTNENDKTKTNNTNKNTTNKPNEDNDEIDDDYNDFYEDDDDVVVSRSSSAVNPRATSATSLKSSDLKSLDDALKDAVKYVSKINERSVKNENKPKKILYLSENRVLSLIKKCKNHIKEQKMEVDNEEPSKKSFNKLKDQLDGYLPLIALVERVFQSYKSLSLSFTYKNIEPTTSSSSSSFAFGATPLTEMSTTMPSLPFNIDFNSVRRTYSLLFGIANETVVEELEKVIDLSVYALCVSIRMLLKKADFSNDEELDQITHALLIVNELPLLEEPKYMDKCTKIFYATMSELPVLAQSKIVRMWSKWHTDELKIFLNKLQQYITVCVISKNLDEENNRNQDEDEDEPENERNCLHKSEGISGAVGCLRLIYYASVLGGRLDSDEQIKKERELEAEENIYFQDLLAHEEPIMFSESTNSLNNKLDPLEEQLNFRVIDCREPKIPNDQFMNEVANKYIDIQHDYVEYIQQVQNLDSRSHYGNKAFKKNIFSFLNNPFFLTLSKKNLGLYYDNKIKMMRERRNNIMMSFIENSAPNPYFKMNLSRNNLLSETLSLIELQEEENPAILRKQLFIEFENEQGIDQGGVSKEFFQLVIDEVLNKGYTFFKYDENTKYYWFTPCTIETEKEFRLIGILFGIAIYNNVLLDVQFPPIFFRKLMGKIGTFEDLYYSHPQLYGSLLSLLQFNGTDQEFQDTFMLRFQISITDNFDTTVSFNLKENGQDVPVTKENRKEFVDLYANFILNKGIEESFKAFRRGFMKIIMNSPLIKWYSPEELEILLCGTKVLDWKSLEDSTLYDSGFESTHPFIKKFWEVFEEFTSEEKMLFLKFTTGTDRCPHGGLSEIKLTIARNGPDTEKLPTAHTCFNVLLLPEYSSKQKLKEKLTKAIQYSRGFGLS